VEFIWQILLTVCLSGTCLQQDVQWFDGKTAKQDCFKMLHTYKKIPVDGDWESVEYTCKPIGKGKRV